MVKKLNNKGSTIVEAAVVMPIVILAIISIVVMMVFFVYSLYVQVSIHWELIDKECAGSKTKVIFEEDKRTYNEDFTFINGKRAMNIDYRLQFDGGGLFKNKLKRKTNARIYEINEKDSIRYFDFFKEQIK